MKRFFFIALVLLIGYILNPSISVAVPVHYSAEGYVRDKHQNMLTISGWIHIDDQLLDWITKQPTEMPIDEMGWDLYQYGYSITEFSLIVGEYSFFGHDGYLYLGEGDLQWNVNGADSAKWDAWYGENFYFYNPDGSSQSYNQYGKLPDLIRFDLLDIWWDDPILQQGFPPFNLLLVSQNHYSVPEPSTAIFWGAIILGMLVYRKQGLPEHVSKRFFSSLLLRKLC